MLQKYFHIALVNIFRISKDPHGIFQRHGFGRADYSVQYITETLLICIQQLDTVLGT